MKLLRILPIFLLLSLLLFTACESSKVVEKEAPKKLVEYQKQAPEWSKNAVIYEVNVRQYTKEGTFKAFQDHLPRLEELGVDILWFMPIHPIGVKNRKGGLGSYYSVKDYEGVNPEFGTMDDFKALVNDAHARGMKVIIDWVANHTAWDNVWVEEGHVDWYTPDSIGGLQPPIGTDWWDVADLNFENEDMRKRMISSMEFWLTNADLDGFRCDVAEWVPDDFWNDARESLDKVKPVFMLAEAEHPEHHDKAFDMSYAWEFHFIMNDVAQGKKDASHIEEYLAKDVNRFDENDYRLVMTSNHDENSWKGTVKERLGDGVQTFAVMAATIQGMPLIYSGQEAGLDHRLEFFEKDEIDWTETPLQGFYKRLNELNHTNEALWNGANGGATKIVTTGDDKQVIAYYREKNGESVLVMLNMSAEEREVNLNSDGIEGFYEELFTGAEREVTTDYKETLGPWNYRVYQIQN